MNSVLRCIKALWYWYLLAIVIVVFDQWTKSLATAHLIYNQPVEITCFLDWRLLWNKGAAFSFLSDAGGWQRWLLVGVSTLATILIAFWWLPTQKRFLSILGMALVLGGAAGNLWDRALVGHVVDFISVHYQDSYFPSFNIADSAISLGAVALMIDWLILEPRDQGNRKASEKQVDSE